jgi:hypothetical protein
MAAHAWRVDGSVHAIHGLQIATKTVVESRHSVEPIGRYDESRWVGQYQGRLGNSQFECLQRVDSGLSVPSSWSLEIRTSYSP